ncbi:hypothetical protein M6D93_15910 [Jatrophihabitans telluris]|uniref:Methyltransferase domain-containing protein n=1 Tax=Jatrophihabitans telluris TaxID=2038343 RepID=A0ABY4QX53_9ACTN|nr:methyltransferase domain-containing protein [Jatrophihabitans telluris]UQX87772.1 hypothetical protein M6D93_15910 [Jatrophihabitans telluris]
MRAGALAPYEGALAGSRPLGFIDGHGRVLPLAIQRYLAEADDADQTVLDRCLGPTLDVGCGPGRIVYALAAAGHAALGVDIAEAAVELTQGRGATALSRDVFERVPGEGRWPTVLLLDGNIGIGGDVTGLLGRVRRLMALQGSVIVEASTAEPGTDEVLVVRFAEAGRPVGPEFGWARVSVDVLVDRATTAGLDAVDYWSAGGRDFVRFERSTSMA